MCVWLCVCTCKCASEKPETMVQAVSLLCVLLCEPGLVCVCLCVARLRPIMCFVLECVCGVENRGTQDSHSVGQGIVLTGDLCHLSSTSSSSTSSSPLDCEGKPHTRPKTHRHMPSVGSQRPYAWSLTSPSTPAPQPHPCPGMWVKKVCTCDVCVEGRAEVNLSRCMLD